VHPLQQRRALVSRLIVDTRVKVEQGDLAVQVADREGFRR